MKRRLFTLAIFLLLGAVVNVAVAWGCAVWLAPQGGSALVTGGDTWLDQAHVWRVHSTPGLGYAEVTSFVQTIPESMRAQFAVALQVSTPAESAIPPWSRIAKPVRTDPATMARRFQSAFGWPRLTMTYEGVFKQHPRGGNVQREISGGIVLYQLKFEAGDKPFRALPLRPLWIGFLANSVFYGAGLWLVWFLKILWPITLLRRFRIKRGLCPACAYPMGKSAVCTECGNELPRHPH